MKRHDYGFELSEAEKEYNTTKEEYDEVETIRLDLKSIIYHKGNTISSGHYYTANKNLTNFTVFNDSIMISKDNHVIYTGVDGTNNNYTLDKPYCFIYQSNVIYDFEMPARL